MSYISDGELEQIRADMGEFMGDDTGLGLTAVIKEIPSNAVSADYRETVVDALACFGLEPADARDMERAGVGVSGGSVKRTWKVYSEVPAVEITPRMRFIHGGIDYRIAAVTKRPRNDAPLYLELLIEDEKVGA
jgi:hypothetical protein